LKIRIVKDHQKDNKSMKRLSIWLMLLLGIGLALVLVGRVSAERMVTDDEVNAVAKQLYCPVCENIPLDVCPTQACIQWRELIRQKLAAGWSPDQIKQYFATQYGDRVLAIPPRRGLNWLVYILPPIAILFGGYLVYRTLRGMKTRPELPGVPGAPPQADSSSAAKDPYLARVEEELRQRR
jgi:cytochrome c-type biogenesis protein CcmH